jgi:molybdenum cofactor biosynthesis enzyme MoaA
MSMLGRIRAWGRPRQATPVPAAPPLFDGYVDELSIHHAAGWLTGPGTPRIRAELAGSGEVLAEGPADQFKFGPSHAGLGRHGFYTLFNRTLSEAERARVVIRAPDGSEIAHAETVSIAYQPVMLNAMDIVDNCNLRCPFCVYDYSKTFTTNVMDEATIEAALRFLPHVLDSNFWFSCLHEPALHPDFQAFLAKVPAEYRRKVFFTTNLAKRMPAEYFAFLADGGFANINISIESLEPTLYERMRKGARQRIFLENWNALIAAIENGKAPPFLRYIVMVYKSNLQEIPSLVDHLLSERRADEIQLRFTFDVPHIPQAFRDTEYVDNADWDWLAAQVAHHPPHKVQVIRPPADEVKAESGVLMPGRFEFKTSWDGTLNIHRFWAVPFDTSGEPPVATVNVKDIGNPAEFLKSISNAAPAG